VPSFKGPSRPWRSSRCYHLRPKNYVWIYSWLFLFAKITDDSFLQAFKGTLALARSWIPRWGNRHGGGTVRFYRAGERRRAQWRQCSQRSCGGVRVARSVSMMDPAMGSGSAPQSLWTRPRGTPNTFIRLPRARRLQRTGSKVSANACPAMPPLRSEPAGYFGYQAPNHRPPGSFLADIDNLSLTRP
jgi:hypothetical protein